MRRAHVRVLLGILLVSTLATACGRDGAPPLTAPSITAVAGVYGLRTINGAPLSPTDEIVSDTLVLWDDGLITRHRRWRALLDPSKIGWSNWSGMFTLDGVTITATYSVFDGVGYGSWTATGTLSGQGTVVKHMTLVHQDTAFLYDKVPIP